MIKICECCGKEYVSTQRGKAGERQRFCSYKCRGKFIPAWNKNSMGLMPIPWNKGSVGIMKSNSGSFEDGHISWNKNKKCPEISGLDNPNYIDGRWSNFIYINKYNKIWKETHKKEIQNYNKQYRKTLTGKIVLDRKRHTRRKLGFNPLNNPFPNSNAHHINFDDVIYIPQEYNKISHNIWTGKNMEIVNVYAYFFLMMQNIDKFGEL